MKTIRKNKMKLLALPPITLFSGLLGQKYKLKLLTPSKEWII